jgi:hypothetical protein
MLLETSKCDTDTLRTNIIMGYAAVLTAEAAKNEEGQKGPRVVAERYAIVQAAVHRSKKE